MVALYVTSSEGGGGKTAVCAGLGNHLLRDGRKVGFFKPVIADGKIKPAGDSDRDTVFIKNLFALEEPADLLCPVFSDESSLKSGVKDAYARVSRQKDVVIIEGVSEQSQVARDIVDALDARVVVVEGYSKESLKAIDSYQGWGEHLLGIALNRVPKNRLEQVRGEISAQSGQAGTKIIGILPEDRTLFAPTIGELTDYIQGETLTGAEKSGELVENIMLGARNVDSGPEYFIGKANKAVVLRASRPDMQLAALETSTRCLVLTGGKAPHPTVLSQAEKKNVPIILTSDDIPTIATNIEEALGKTRFNQETKLPRLNEIMEQHFDFTVLYQGLGLAD